MINIIRSFSAFFLLPTFLIGLMFISSSSVAFADPTIESIAPLNSQEVTTTNNNPPSEQTKKAVGNVFQQVFKGLFWWGNGGGGVGPGGAGWSTNGVKVANYGLPFSGGGDSSVSIAKIIKTIILYVGIASLLSLTYAGILLMVSYGDDGKVKNAKKIITFALLGIIISGASYLVIDIINALRV